MAVADGQVLAQSIYFAQRRETGKHLRAGVDEVAFLSIVVVLQPTHENVVVWPKRMIHTDHDMGPCEFGRRIPSETGRV